MSVVSVILPTHKEPPNIKKAIDSIFSQSFSEWELIIVDDGLSSNIRKMVDCYVNNDRRVRIVSNSKNLGLQKSLNKGLLVSTGKYIARVDDDDVWIDEDKLKKQVNFLDNNPDYVLVGTDAVICDQNFVDLQTYTMPKSDVEIRNRILFKNCFLHSTVLIRKSAMDSIGQYLEKEEVRHVEDYDLWLRIGLAGKIANLDMKSTRLMVGEGSLTFRNRIKQSQRDLVLTFKYRKKYPYFYFALLIAFLRLCFFYFNCIFPAPNKVLYKIQAMYKSI